MESSVPVGWLATALGISFAWPQALHAIRSVSLRGVSPMTQSLMLATALSWAAYGVTSGDRIIIVANLAAGIAVSVTAVAMMRQGLLSASLLGGVIGAWAFSVSLGIWIIGETAPGLIGAVLGMAMTAPQAFALHRGRIPVGVSSSTYLLLGLTMSAWLVYGILTRDPVVIAPNVVAVPIVAGIWWKLKTAPVALDSGPFLFEEVV